MKEPLNGKKTHPLSAHAIGVLRQLATHGPLPRHQINAGVNNRFERENLTEEYAGPNGWNWVRISEGGRKVLETLQ